MANSNNTPKNNPMTLEEALEQVLAPKLKRSKTSSEAIEEKAEDIKVDIFDRISSRDKIHTMINEYVVTEDFINRVRRYARQEFDSMLLKVFIWFAGIAVGTAIALLLSGWLK